jgi:hypothetical protein
MRENLRYFGYITPDPAEFQVQDRPRVITLEAREAVLDFLFKNGKIAYINKVRFFFKG